MEVDEPAEASFEMPNIIKVSGVGGDTNVLYNDIYHFLTAYKNEKYVFQAKNNEEKTLMYIEERDSGGDSVKCRWAFCERGGECVYDAIVVLLIAVCCVYRG